jgi:hypothetical protein
MGRQSLMQYLVRPRAGLCSQTGEAWMIDLHLCGALTE